MASGLICLLFWVTTALADQPIRIAYLHSELNRDGPGLLVRDILSGKDTQILALINVLTEVRPDVLVLGGIDLDAGGVAPRLLAEALAVEGLSLPNTLPLSSNAGRLSGVDVDDDGRSREPEDRQAFGRFSGSGGMAVLSRFPLPKSGRTNQLDLLWSAIPWGNSPDGDIVAQKQRLSSHGHWIVPVEVAPQVVLRLFTIHASPPVFDGPEDRNGLRNADEIRLVAETIEDEGNPGGLIVLGTLNADPEDGEARAGALEPLLSSPWLSDPGQHSAGAQAAAMLDGGVNDLHAGDPAHDTVDWPDDTTDAPGNLRVDYVLPSSDLQVLGSGTYWPAPGRAGADKAALASRHRVVWVDLLPRSPTPP